jgi:hypothetical protein
LPTVTAACSDCGTAGSCARSVHAPVVGGARTAMHGALARLVSRDALRVPLP